MIPVRHYYARLMAHAQHLAARVHTTTVFRSERGSATVEYAIAALAAAAFAALLIAVVTSPEIRTLLTKVITKALKTR
ncbi:MAG: DUF4244 domain-containing protein [Bowdeniella nasicola]|nr:DUF4244 domain-containing protein [Bowdeniella nasicola]